MKRARSVVFIASILALLSCSQAAQTQTGTLEPSPSRADVAWYKRAMTADSGCPAVFTTPANGNGTQAVGDPDPSYNQRLFATMSVPGTGAGAYQPYVCDFDRATAQFSGSGRTNGGADVCSGRANPHTQPQIASLSHGYVGVWACGPNIGGTPTWGDANYRKPGSKNQPLPFAIGNCAGPRDCAGVPNAMDITARTNQLYLPSLGLSEGSSSTNNGVTTICGQNNGMNAGGYQAGTQGCAVIRYVSPGVFAVDVACASGAEVTAWTIGANPTNEACGDEWQFGTNVHSDILGTMNFTGISSPGSLTVQLPPQGTFAGATCTVNAPSTTPSVDVFALVDAVDKGTMSGPGCDRSGSYYNAAANDQCNALFACSMVASTKLQRPVSAGQRSLAVANASGFAPNQMIDIDNPASRVEERGTISGVTSNTIALASNLAHPHAAGSVVVSPATASLFSKSGNPSAMAAATITGCTGCTQGVSGFHDKRANNSGTVNHFGYGHWGMRYTAQGLPVYCEIEDTQVMTSTYAGVLTGVNGVALNLLFFCSRGPDVTVSGARGTHGVWQFTDVGAIAGASATGVTYNVSPAWEAAWTIGATPPPGQVNFLAGPYTKCTNVAKTACTTYRDNGTTPTNVLGMVNNCAGQCTPARGIVPFLFDVTMENQALYANNQRAPLQSNYDWAIDSKNDAWIFYVCSDATKGYAVEICYVKLSSATGQTVAQGFVDDNNRFTVLNQPNVAGVRTPSGKLVVLESWGNNRATGCTGRTPCLFESVYNGSTWKRTKLADPSWAGRAAIAGSACSMNAEPQGRHIYALCFSPPQTSGSAPYYLYDLYTGDV